MGRRDDGAGFDVPAALPEIRRRLLARPEAREWPALRELIERPVREDALPCWDWALLASRAVGGTDEDAQPAATAIFCLFYAVHLVDDLLDEDPEGAQHRLGVGPVANLASCLQGLASVVLDADLDADLEDPLDEPGRAWSQARLGQVAASTALGQHLDAADADDEAGYWRLARAKTPPLFVAALGLGAVHGGVGGEQAEAIAALGIDLGLLVQVSDDLADALARPAAVDWQRRGTNLPILVARRGDHGEQARFRRLRRRVAEGDETALAEAQEILLRSGAVSYAVYCMIERARAARAALGDLAIEDPGSLDFLLRRLARPVLALLERVGVEAPAELVELDP